ncbi:lycopene cyclase [Pedobacter sp. N36a]|uniref:lycopene cyclase family protein n=1 Tax=Pedobacter sp. N36a TaxID=2767996 RepID=UPI001657209C|nr:lycopene cyclase family protein [Pedobacter sp. N36a]MBC8988140.1 lycopene cyclase [Pedobacter sp. N36a]
MEHFDYIIAGGGCAGRSLAVRLLPYLQATNKRALLVDYAEKKSNDRTWCFWEQDPDVFEPAVYRKWKQLSFASKFLDRELDIQPYQYKMIRGLDFYAHTDQLLANQPQLIHLQGKVERQYTEKDQACVVIDGKTFSSDYVFSSIPQVQEKKPDRYQYFLQHFEGWVIETEGNTFDPESATLMDFNTSQQAGTSFVYVLPLSANRALVEYTIFSKQELAPEDYSAALQQYIREQLKCEQYTIIEHEHGVIPMTDHPIKRQQERIIYLGTAGGFTKGSTGYTFRFIQKNTAAIVQQLMKSGHPNIPAISSPRFELYDATLLHLLDSERISGEEIFSRMFKKNSAMKILKFLDNESSLLEELQIFSTLQKTEFAMALWNRTLKLIRSN